MILQIEGQSTEGMTGDEAAAKIKGPPGTTIQLLVARNGAPEPLELRIQRERIHVHTVLGFGRDDDDRWDYLIARDPLIGYVRITAFSRDTAAELRRALTKLKVAGMQGLVVDLRFNPGGLLTSAVDVADLFIAEGLIVATDGRNTERKEWKAQQRGTLTDVPLAVLVNQFSASASEVTAAALQDHGRAVIVGERTWGKGSVQNVVELENGQGALKLTTSSYHRPSGKNIHRFVGDTEDDPWGVTPDEGFLVELAPPEIRQLLEDQQARDVIHPKNNETAPPEDAPKNGQDAAKPSFDRQLQRAMEFLREKIAVSAESAKEAG
jgi:carboxyl-terminal processing protease